MGNSTTKSLPVALKSQGSQLKDQTVGWRDLSFRDGNVWSICDHDGTLMSKYHIILVVYFLNGHADSVSDQVDILVGMHDEGIHPAHDGIRRKQVEGVLGVSLEYRARTSLRHLFRAGLVERDPEVADDLRTFVIADWLGADGEIVNGRVAEVTEEAIEALIRHIHDTDPSEEETEVIADGSGVPLRRVLAEGLDLPPADLEDYLRKGDLVRNLREAVQIIEEHPAVSSRDDYGMILFRNEAYRYRLADRAMDLFRL